MSIAPESIDRARQSDILVVAQRYGALKRAGAGEYVGPCRSAVARIASA